MPFLSVSSVPNLLRSLSYVLVTALHIFNSIILTAFWERGNGPILPIGNTRCRKTHVPSFIKISQFTDERTGGQTDIRKLINPGTFQL